MQLTDAHLQNRVRCDGVCSASNPTHHPTEPHPPNQWPSHPFTWAPARVPFGWISALIFLEALFLFGPELRGALFHIPAPVESARGELWAQGRRLATHFMFMGGLGIVAMLALDGYRASAHATDSVERANAAARLDAWFGAVVLYVGWILVMGANVGDSDLLAMTVLLYGPTLAISIPLLGWAALQIRSKTCARCLLAGFAILNTTFQALYLQPSEAWRKHDVDETRCLVMVSLLVFLVVGAWTIVVEWKAWESEWRSEA